MFQYNLSIENREESETKSKEHPHCQVFEKCSSIDHFSTDSSLNVVVQESD